MDNTIQEASRRLFVLEVEERLRDGFREMDALVLAELSDRQLAMLQSEVGRETPQFIRADQEWQRRLLARQLRSDRFGAVLGLIGVALGAFLAWLFTKF